jgi:ParB family chromosome partitioning protein
MPVSRVASGRIDTTDSTFRITTADDIDALCLSIGALGVLAPPILQSAGNAYRVVSGFRRIAACRRLGRVEVPARLLGPETPRLVSVRLAIADNTGQRPLNLIEQSRAIRLLTSALPADGDLGQALGSVGLTPNCALARKIGLLAALPEVIQEGVLAETLSLAMALELGGMPAEEGVLLARLFNALRPSLNKQREIATLATEIARRDGRDLVTLFSSEPLAGICGAPEMDRNRKIREIRVLLYQKRYPELSRFEGRIAQALRDLKLAPGLNLVPPRHFESPTWTATLAFDSKAALREGHLALAQLLEDPALERILKKIDG